MAAGEPILYSLYVYAPNKGAPIFFTIAFAISAIFHIWQCYRYKAFKLIGLHPVCAVLFTVGYALREYGALDNYLYSTTTKTPLIIFIVSQIFIYICPPLLELANYHVLARVFYYVPYCSPLPPGRVLAIFGGSMVAVELLNSLGVSFAANPASSPEQQTLGSHLTIAAVALQLAIILIFFILAGLFHRRLSKASIHAQPVKAMLTTLYTSMALIFARCVYRLVEHAGNTKVELTSLAALRSLSPLLRHEAFFYVFEASLMLLNSALWNVWHPGRFLPHDNLTYLARDGSGEVRREETPDGRTLAAKVGNVVTLGALFRRKELPEGFLELDRYSERGESRRGVLEGGA
ncbi:uncharacterized protein B0H64DRAFT_424132 [Chaetomium fimeti]|uniref:RTA1 domain-containing protein n=1 Tax=Chaetomium fimeti TaxID=1854472 RepID=A0AAE0LS18_9PEZI|nr:hypothetical protein B0H64DRAFT_424132 [Chaetomium fimeti]